MDVSLQKWFLPVNYLKAVKCGFYDLKVLSILSVNSLMVITA